MPTEAIKPTHKWNLPNCRVSIDDLDTKQWALWIMNNLTKNNKDYISKVLPIMIQINGWLSEDTAMMLAPVIEDRTKALIKAIDSGKVESKKICSLTYARERYQVGAAICEIVSQGEGNEFFNVLSPNK